MSCIKPTTNTNLHITRQNASQPFVTSENQNQGITLSTNLSYFLGTNQQNTQSANTYVYNTNQLIYYNKNMYVKYHIVNKNYRIFYQKQTQTNQNQNLGDRNNNKNQQNSQQWNNFNYALGSNNMAIDKVKQNNLQIDKNCYQNGSVLICTKFFQCGLNSLFVALKKVHEYYYLSMFWTEIDQPAFVIRISQDKKQIYTSFNYSPKKGYIYLLYKIKRQDSLGSDQQYEKQQHLKIIQVLTPSTCPHCCNLAFSASLTSTQKKISRPMSCQSSFLKQKQNIMKKTFCQLSPKIKIILDCLIKRTGGSTHDIDDLIATQDCTEIYLYGKDYFRNWKLQLNQKQIKQSNYRNIQRNIKKQKVQGVYWLNQSYFTQTNHKHPQKQPANRKNKTSYLLIITSLQILFIYNNQLIHITQIPSNSSTKQNNNQTAQLLLQKSLNQLCRNKFRMETNGSQDSDNIKQQRDRQKQKQRNSERQYQKNGEFYGNGNRIGVISKIWVQNYNQVNNHATNTNSSSSNKQIKMIKFCAATKQNQLCIYQIQADMSIKIINTIKQFDNIFGHHHYNQMTKKINNSNNNNNNSNSNRYKNKNQGLNMRYNMNVQQNQVIKNISISDDGNLILLTDIFHQNYLNNQTLDNQNFSIQPLYSAGHCHTSPIISLSCPQIFNYLASVSSDGSLKIWSKSQKDRSLFIDAKFKMPPLQAVIHPSGLCIAVNFGVQIKVYGIVSNQLQQIISVKTNDFCRSIQFCKNTNFLITNQKSIIKIYDPFTLQNYNKIQSQDLRLQYRNVKISQNGQYLIYQCCNDKIYRQSLATTLATQADSIISNANKLFKYQEFDKKNQNQYKFCHRQSQQYTCFYFNFGSSKSNSIAALQNQSRIQLKQNNIFVGFTKSKYMVLYANFGEFLIAEFPIVDGVYVTCYCISQHVLFLGTNKGTIRSYKWPILQSHLQTQITNKHNSKGQKIAYLKPPKMLSQFLLWPDHSAVTSLLKISNSQELIAGAIDGSIGFINYTIFKNKTQIMQIQAAQMMSTQRKRMVQSTNNIKFIKISQLDKIIKLIQKTQTDINKIQHQINNQKLRKNKQLKQQQQQLKNNAQKRKKANISQRQQKFKQLQKQLKKQQIQYKNKKNQLQNLIKFLQADYSGKINYQKQRIQGIKKQIQNQKFYHRQRIIKLIDQHKSDIKKIKQTNLQYVRNLQKQFENIVNKNYKQQDQQIQQLRQISLNQQLSDPQIQTQKIKVFQLEQCIQQKKKQLQKIYTKAQNAKYQDQQKQKQFQQSLEKYNQYRYQNLILHSQLLKIQNQLFQRKEILEKKDQIIKMAFHQKSTNQTFKEFVSGAIMKLEDQKQSAYDQYVRKQQNLKILFQQLTSQINKSENKKLKLVQLKQRLKIYQRQGEQNSKNINISIQQLKNLKKYLLVQGASQDSQHKKFYQEQQKLLSSIKWLQKRFKMNSINEKKLTNLKKSGVSQIVNQNKNLLEQCNQLRQQDKIVQIKINHLGKKLAQARQIIQFEDRLKNQKNVISKQNQKLNQIRKMFKDQIQLMNKQLPQQSQKQ